MRLYFVLSTVAIPKREADSHAAPVDQIHKPIMGMPNQQNVVGLIVPRSLSDCAMIGVPMSAKLEPLSIPPDLDP
ncbi:hypothetical protein ACEN2J_16575 [Pseudorhodobacter sp. W20_MBD10_FR17]|uniref:hypothetical protein n=1 Tax=Pseudorhodobacter sp. W20_MBD10_FR17 TaxID=3240266 RepID=UPI003F9D3E39